MYKIYIDSTDRYLKIVKLLKDDVELDVVNGDIDISSTIAEILKKHNLSPEQVETYDVNPGPGSFTGIKIGVTIANIFNWALGKKSSKNLVKPEYGREPNITLRK